MYAACDGHKDTVELLVQLGADVNPKNDDEMTGAGKRGGVEGEHKLTRRQH